MFDKNSLGLIINPQIRSKEWADLVQNSKFASFFQTEQAYNFYASQSYLDTFAIGVVEDEKLRGVVVGYIQSERGILNLFSKRAIVLGGPLLDDNISTKSIIELLSELKSRTKSAIYIEIRNSNNYSAFDAAIRSQEFIYEPHYNVLIKCDDYQSVFNRMDENRRRVLSKNLPSCFSWKFASCRDDIFDYYEILKSHYYHHVRKPLFPYSFFEEIVNSRTGKILVLCDGSKVIGGMLQLNFNNKVLYDYYVCALDQDYKGISPSVRIYDYAIKYAIESGCHTFDTMGAGSPSQNYGVRDFKLRFGGKLVEFGRYKFIHNKILYQIGRFALALITQKNN